MKKLSYLFCADFVTFSEGYVWSASSGIWGFGEYLGNILPAIPAQPKKFVSFSYRALSPSDSTLSYWLRKNR